MATGAGEYTAQVLYVKQTSLHKSFSKNIPTCRMVDDSEKKVSLA